MPRRRKSEDTPKAEEVVKPAPKPDDLVKVRNIHTAKVYGIDVNEVGELRRWLAEMMVDLGLGVWHS